MADSFTSLIGTKQGFIRHRYVICILVFSGLALVYAMRVNLGVAIIAMAGTSASNETDTNGTCIVGSHDNGPAKKGEFDWSDTMRDSLLGAFFYGYISTQVAGGILADKFSIKWVFGYGIFLTSVLTIMTQWIARWNVYAFFVLRVLEGITEGVTFPSLYCLMARWAPASERTTMTTLSIIGTNIGTVITMPITAALCDSEFFGWPASFYLPGIAGVIWSIAWYICATSQPENHRWISDEERDYIVKNRGTTHSRSRRIPWTKILLSPAVWVFSISRLIMSITFYMFLTEMPTFVDKVFGIALSSNGVLNGFFYVLYACSSFGTGMLSDVVIKRNILSRTNTRKAFECTGFIISGLMLILVTQLGCNYNWVAVVLCISCVFLAFSGGGDAAMALDLAPDLAGSVMGFGNMVGNVGAIVATKLVSATNNPTNIQAGWNLAFTITAATSFFGALLFVFFATAEEQPWSKEETDQTAFAYDESEEDLAEAAENVKRPSITYSGIH